MTTKKILQLLPYSSPFLFVDELLEVTDEGVTGTYTYKPDEYFYKGHFTDYPITPGVILTETMAQIAVVPLGIYLYKDKLTGSSLPQIVLTTMNINFFVPVYPGEKVTVRSKKNYFRFGKLDCEVEMINSEGKTVCRGQISGFIKPATCA